MKANTNNLCVFDIGSNSVIATLVSYNDNKLKVYLDDSIVTELAQGLKVSSKIKTNDIFKTIDAIKSLKEKVIGRAKKQDLKGLKFYAFGTEALRKAENLSEFKTLFANNFLDISLEIIDGNTEAKLVSKVISSSYKYDLLIDIGGGSSEFILQDSKILESVSVGARTYSKERIEVLKPVLKKIKKELKPNGNIVITGGTVSAFVAGLLGLNSFSQEKTEGYFVLKTTVEEYFNKLSKDNLYLCNFVRFDKGREEVLLGGLSLLIYIIDFLEIDSFVVSNFGARFGYILELLKSYMSVDSINKFFWNL